MDDERLQYLCDTHVDDNLMGLACRLAHGAIPRYMTFEGFIANVGITEVVRLLKMDIIKCCTQPLGKCYISPIDIIKVYVY